MIRQFIKGIPFLYSSALNIKHQLWNKKTKKGFEEYLKNNNLPKLQLGAGANELPGWFNTDYFARPNVFFLDVTKGFQFPGNTFGNVFSEHHIEHITYKDAQIMLSETFRVIKPGGYIKIITPDLRKYVQSYAGNALHTPVIKQHVADWIYSGFDKAVNYIPISESYEAHFINDIFLNYEHRFIYDEQALKALLEKAGFINIISNDAIGTGHSDFRGIETHASAFDQSFNLSVQAQKPLS